MAGVTGPRFNLSSPDPDVVDDLIFFRTRKPGPAPSPLSDWREVRALARRLENVIEAWNPEILHAHSPALNGLAALGVARRKGLPLLYEIRAFWEDAAVGNGSGREGSPRYRLIRALETHIARKADAVAVICEGLRSDLIARGIGGDKVMVSPNGVDLALFGDPPPPDHELGERLGLIGKDVVGFIGSFYDYEGLDDLIAAMPMLVAERAQAHLLMVGGGPMEPALRKQALESPVADRIHFIGRVPHHEVERYYSLIDVLAYPRKAMRLTELVTPLKPLEAMAQRRLVAASDVGGHRELIEDGVTGALFPPDNPVALAGALSGMFEDRSGWEQRRNVAQAFVERDRNWSSNVSRYEPVYRKLIERAA